MIEPIRIIKGQGIPLPGDDIDTDRIIPARFMKCVTFDSLGEYVFYDERYDGKGSQKKHVLNDQKYAEGNILIVGKNFGCGSSREHAPQALLRWGIQALIGESFAEIFAGNCTALGMPAVTVEEKDREEIEAKVAGDPKTKIVMDLEKKSLTVAGSTYTIAMNEGYRQALISGSWDTTSLLISNLEEIKKTAKKIPYLAGFADR